MTSRDVLDPVKNSERDWGWPIFGAGVLLAAMILTIVVNTLPATYTAESIVAVRAKGTSDVPADEQMLLAGEYSVYLSSDANIAPATRSYPKLDANGVAVTVDPNTATLRIQVKSPSATESVSVANSISALAIERGRNDDRVQIVPLANASASSIEVGPKRTLYLLSGFVLILAAAGTVLYLRKKFV